MNVIATPSVSMIAVCERVEREANGRLTLRSLIESVTVRPHGVASFVIVIGTHGGELRGTARWWITAVDPLGNSASEEMSAITPLHGVVGTGDYAILDPVQMRCPVEGVYWIDVSFAADTEAPPASYPRRVLARRPMPVLFRQSGA
jgi:hypothetical protein